MPDKTATPNAALLALPPGELAIRTEAAERRLGNLVGRLHDIHARAWHQGLSGGVPGRCAMCGGRCGLSGDWVPRSVRRTPEGLLLPNEEAAPTEAGAVPG